MVTQEGTRPLLIEIQALVDKLIVVTQEAYYWFGK